MNSYAIKISNLSISQNEQKILEDVNLNINHGSFIYLIGTTGSGKSTFLKSLYKEAEIEKGEIEILHQNLSEIKDKEVPFLRRKLGIVFQDMQLLSDRSIYKNLEFVLQSTGWKDKERINERINDVLEIVHLEDIENKMPFELSGGAQQRVSIARSLLNKPSIIIADEPTGNLDPEKSNIIIEIMQEINQKGTTIIIATHNHSIIEKFPHITYEFKDRKIKEIKIN